MTATHAAQIEAAADRAERSAYRLRRIAYTRPLTPAEGRAALKDAADAVRLRRRLAGLAPTAGR